MSFDRTNKDAVSELEQMLEHEIELFLQYPFM